MSAKASFWAWEQPVKGNTKLVLLSLANYANDKDESWHSYENMAKACGISRRTVIRECAKLQELGLLVISHRKESEVKNLTNIFKLIINIGSDTQSLGVVTHSHQGSDTQSPKSKRESKRESKNKEYVAKATCDEVLNNEKENAVEQLWTKISHGYKQAKSPIGAKQKAITLIKRIGLSKFESDVMPELNKHIAAVKAIKESGGSISLPNLTTWINQERWTQPVTDYYQSPQAKSKAAQDPAVGRRSRRAFN